MVQLGQSWSCVRGFFTGDPIQKAELYVGYTLATGTMPITHRRWQPQLDHFTRSKMHGIMSPSRARRDACRQSDGGG
jgi:hypothetical protein